MCSSGDIAFRRCHFPLPGDTGFAMKHTRGNNVNTLAAGFLGARAGVNFQDAEGEEAFPHITSLQKHFLPSIWRPPAPCRRLGKPSVRSLPARPGVSWRTGGLHPQPPPFDPPDPSPNTQTELSFVVPPPQPPQDAAQDLCRIRRCRNVSEHRPLWVVALQDLHEKLFSYIKFWGEDSPKRQVPGKARLTILSSLLKVEKVKLNSWPAFHNYSGLVFYIFM